MTALLALGGGSGLFDSVAGLIGLAASLVLVLMLVAMAGIAYKSLVGDGIEWPDDRDDGPSADDEVREGSDEDEWKYY